MSTSRDDFVVVTDVLSPVEANRALESWLDVRGVRVEELSPEDLLLELVCGLKGGALRRYGLAARFLANGRPR